tara:strand:+ start:489 stop:1925 length:1437 start_codon:yes stop_codon:yes gene_type:complete
MPKLRHFSPRVGANDDPRSGPINRMTGSPPSGHPARIVAGDAAASTVASPSVSGGSQELGADTTAVILAGGKGTRLGSLTRHECKPALPFGGRYRNIDFSLSNCVNSGIRAIGVATQYKDASLLRHLAEVWQDGAQTSDKTLAPWRPGTDGYCGTADAVFQNWSRIESLQSRLVLVLAGDHVYQMDYRPMLEQHLATGADVTVGCVEVPIDDARQFGVMAIDASKRVMRFSEKPKRPQPLPGRSDSALGSMGIYVFNRETLGRMLQQDSDTDASSHDFGADLIPRLVDTARVVAYPFTGDAAIGGGYWRDVGTVAAYWRAHMELLDGIPGFRLDDPAWPMHPMRPSQDAALIANGANGRVSRIEQSLLALGCGLDDATLHRCVLSEGVTVAENSYLEHAVILPDAVIGRGCRLSNVIVETGAQVPDGTIVLPNRYSDNDAPTLITAESRSYIQYKQRAADRQLLGSYSGSELQQRTGT